MAYKIYKNGNIVYIEDVDTGALFEGRATDFIPRRSTVSSTDFYFSGVNGWTQNRKVNLTELQNKEGVPFTVLEDLTSYLEGFNSGGGNGEGVTISGDLVDSTNPENIIINTPSANQVFAENPVIYNTNPTMQSPNEQAWTFQRLGDIGITQNPTFHLGRIINGGINEPKFRFMFRDDLHYTTEVPCFELEPSGTLASLRQVIGSHYEGFIGIEEKPMFRISSTDLGRGNRGSRIELGSGGLNDTDVFLEKTGANEFRIVLGGGTKQIFYADSVFKPSGIVDVYQDSPTPTPSPSGTSKVYSKNGLMHQMDESGREVSLIPTGSAHVAASNTINSLSGIINKNDDQNPILDDINLNTSISSYVEQGYNRYYNVRFYANTSNSFSFEVGGAIDIGMVLGGNNSVDVKRNGVNSIDVSPIGLFNGFVDITFIAFMSNVSSS